MMRKFSNDGDLVVTFQVPEHSVVEGAHRRLSPRTKRLASAECLLPDSAAHHVLRYLHWTTPPLAKALRRLHTLLTKKGAFAPSMSPPSHLSKRRPLVALFPL